MKVKITKLISEASIFPFFSTKISKKRKKNPLFLSPLSLKFSEEKHGGNEGKIKKKKEKRLEDEGLKLLEVIFTIKARYTHL